MDLTVKPPGQSRKYEGAARAEDIVLPTLPPMATIHDDDELLLARIGYKQVKLYWLSRPYLKALPSSQLTPFKGIATRIFQMVHRFVCHFHPGHPGIRASHIRFTAGCWRPSHSRVVLVDRLLHGLVHRQLCGRVSVCIPHGWGHVFCHEARRPR